MPPPVARDVDLHFGRPDIAKFILDALNVTPTPSITAGAGVMAGSKGSHARAGEEASGKSSNGNRVMVSDRRGGEHP